jgi:tRNA (cytidine/uridine-2'-O-)-methyltransferase
MKQPTAQVHWVSIVAAQTPLFSMFNVVLVEPEIPPNTGNIIRLCANTGANLHLIEPLGFPLDDARMKRAGLDYHEFAQMRVHADWESFEATEKPSPQRIFAFTTRGAAPFHQQRFEPGDWFVFGPETRGLSADMLARFGDHSRVRLPMRPDNRSLNLSNTVAVVVFEAWRQHGFAGGV